MNDLDFIKQYIDVVPDFPMPGVIYRDIMPLLSEPPAFQQGISRMRENAPDDASHIVAIEARGFIFGAALAVVMRLPFVPIRKPGKLPKEVVSVDYELEYGKNQLVMQKDALPPGAKVHLVDDLLATGGTLAAACQLIERLGGEVRQMSCLIELDKLNGRKCLPDVPLYTLLHY